MYNNVKCLVRTANGLTAAFAVTGGLKQGCVISPLLFNMYLNNFVTELKEVEDGISMNRRQVPILLCADDIVLLAKRFTNSVG